MKPLNRWTCSFMVIVSVALVAYSVLAQASREDRQHNTAADGRTIAAQLDQHKTTLAKAVANAEEHSKGRAISVISDVSDHGGAAVHVWCITGDPPKIMKCYFDTATGSVKGMKEVHEFPITRQEHAQGLDAQGDDAKGHDAHERAKQHDADAPGAAEMIKSQTVEAGCGACIYKMPGVEGCPLAVVIDGKPYLVEGAKWPNHDYCDAKQQAVATGKLENGKFIATSLEPKK